MFDELHLCLLERLYIYIENNYIINNCLYLLGT